MYWNQIKYNLKKQKSITNTKKRLITIEQTTKRKIMKIQILTAALGLSVLASHANVVITEYVEGGGNNKAIEISNLGTTDVDLAAGGYKIDLYANGKTETTNGIALQGLLIPGSSIVVYNEGSTDAFKFDAPQGLSDASATYFNGDDAIILSNSAGVVDSFGQFGEDPGKFWGTGDFETKDHTLRRLVSVTEGDTTTDDAFDPATQWATFAKDTADGLGCTGEAACDGTQPMPTAGTSIGDTSDSSGIVVITEYIEGGGNNKAIEISNLGTGNVDLAVEGYKLQLYANGKTVEPNELLLQGLLIPGSSIVVYNDGSTDEFKFDAPQGIPDASATYFNGDDAILLVNNDGVVDSFGQLGTDPGKFWGTGDFETKDHTLRRLTSVTEGDTITDDAFDPANQWATFAKDTSDGLGCKDEVACDGTQALPTEGTPLGDGSTPSAELCTNCPDLTKVADRATYVEATYYTTANASDASALRSAITKDISAYHKQLTYSEVWTALTSTDEDPANTDNIILLYSGRSIAKADNGSGAASSNQNFWNREHTWAKSHGFPDTSQLGYTDIHHLRPTDISMNSDRGNRDFDIGGTPNAEEPANMSTENTWEPRDEVKGDVARMMFYMDVRYDAGTESTMPDLILVDTVGTPTSTLSDGKGELGKLCTLFDWHSQDPVDTVETNRNHSIYEYQGNRNPFIDHPEWVDSLYGSACGGTGGGSTDGGDQNEAPTVSAGADQSVASAANVTLKATATDSDGSIASYAWTQVSGKPATLVNTDSDTVTFVAPKVGSDQSLVFSVTVTDDLGKTSTASVTINVAAEVIETKSTGGSFYFLLAAFALASLRRVKKCYK
jgi:endonuclease I